MAGMKMFSPKQQVCPLYLLFSNSWSPSVHLSFTNVKYSVTHTIHTYLHMCMCVCSYGVHAGHHEICSLGQSVFAKRTHTITTLPQFICHGSLTSFNCQAELSENAGPPKMSLPAPSLIINFLLE